MKEREKGFVYALVGVLSLGSYFSAGMYSRFTAGVPDLLTFAAAQVFVFVGAALFGVFCLNPKSAPHSAFCRAASALGLALLAASQLAQFALFLGTFTHPSLRFWGFMAAFIAACVLTARRGRRAVFRSGALFFTVNVLIWIWGGFVLAVNAELDKASLAVNLSDLPGTAALTFCRLAPLPALLAFPEARTKKTGVVVAVWGGVSSAFAALIAVLSFGVLGGSESLCVFPFYTAAQAVGMGELRRLDVFFLCARNVGAFVLISLLFCAIGSLFRGSGELVKSEGNEEEGARPFSVQLVCAAASFAAVYAAVEFEPFCALLLSPWTTLLVSVFTLFIVPLLGRISFKWKRTAPAALLLSVCLAFPALSGCEKVQLQDRMIIKGVGIDKSGGKYLVTVQYIDNYSDGDKQVNKVVSVTGGSVSEALGRLKDSTGSEPFLGQTEAVIIGSETAKGDLAPTMSYFMSYSELSPTTRLYLSETTALELLGFSQEGELLPIDHITSISPSARNDARFTLIDFTNSLLNRTDTPCAAMLGVSGGSVRLSTVAYLPPGRVGKLDENEYLAYSLLLGLDSEAVINEGGASCEVVRCKTKLEALPEGEGLRLCADCRPELSVLENPRRLSNAELERVFSDKLSRIICDSVYAITIQDGCDICGFGKTLPPSYPAAQNEADYAAVLSRSKLTVNVSCRVTEAKALR